MLNIVDAQEGVYLLNPNLIIGICMIHLTKKKTKSCAIYFKRKKLTCINKDHFTRYMIMPKGFS